MCVPKLLVRIAVRFLIWATEMKLLISKTSVLLIQGCFIMSVFQESCAGFQIYLVQAVTVCLVGYVFTFIFPQSSRTSIRSSPILSCLRNRLIIWSLTLSPSLAGNYFISDGWTRFSVHAGWYFWGIHVVMLHLECTFVIFFIKQEHPEIDIWWSPSVSELFLYWKHASVIHSSFLTGACDEWSLSLFPLT